MGKDIDRHAEDRYNDFISQYHLDQLKNADDKKAVEELVGNLTKNSDYEIAFEKKVAPDNVTLMRNGVAQLKGIEALIAQNFVLIRQNERIEALLKQITEK